MSIFIQFFIGVKTNQKTNKKVMVCAGQSRLPAKTAVGPWTYIYVSLYVDIGLCEPAVTSLA